MSDSNIPLDRFCEVFSKEMKEEEKKQVVFQYLAKYTFEELTKNLEESSQIQVKKYAKLRNIEIIPFFKELNTKFDFAENLESIEAYTNYKKSKDAFKKVMITEDYTFHVLQQLIEQGEAKKIGSKVNKIVENFFYKNVPPALSCLNPFSNFIQKFESYEIDFKKGSSSENKAKEVRDSFVEGLVRGVPSFTEDIKKYLDGKFHDAVKLINFKELEKEAQIVIEKQKKEREEKIKQVTPKLSEALTKVQNCFDIVKEDGEYQQYLTKKEEIRKELKHLFTFCSLNELTAHKKATNESKDWIIKQTYLKSFLN